MTNEPASGARTAAASAIPTTERAIEVALAGDITRMRAMLEQDAALATGRSQFLVSPIHAAHYGGHAPLVDLLLASGVELDGFLAAELDMTDRVEAALQEQPALALARNPQGATLLHGAAYWCAYDTAELLLRSGAHVNAPTVSDLGIAPLGSAVASPDIPNPSQNEERVAALVRLLLSHGADVNHRRSDGLTALHTAAWSGHLDVMGALLLAGADPTIAGEKDGPHPGRTAEMSAHSQGHEAAVALLRRA